MTKKDLQALRRVLRFVSTSDTTIQNEVLRLDAVLEQALKPPKEKPNGPHN